MGLQKCDTLYFSVFVIMIYLVTKSKSLRKGLKRRREGEKGVKRKLLMVMMPLADGCIYEMRHIHDHDIMMLVIMIMTHPSKMSNRLRALLLTLVSPESAMRVAYVLMLLNL